MNIHALINYRDAISRVMIDDVIEITFAPGASVQLALEWDSPIATVVTKTPITTRGRVKTIPRSKVRGYLIKLAYDHAISSVSVRGTMIYPVLEDRDAFCARREWESAQEFYDAYFKNYPDEDFGFSENN